MNAQVRRFHSRPPGIRALLTGLAFGVLAFPAAIFFLVTFLISGGINEQPIMRFVSVNQEVRRAVEADGKGGLRARDAYVAPPWLELVVVDLSGRVLLSNIAGIEVGGALADGRIAAYSASHFAAPSSGRLAPPSAGLPPAGCYYAETVEEGGAVLGSYYAFLPPLDLRKGETRDNALYRLLFLGVLALFAVLAGAGVAALLGRAVMRLERSAGAIAAGDLDSAVMVRGVREIQALSEAMDRMRATLRGDRDRRARFLAAVSHDLRTPLTSIGGYLEAVEDGLAAEPETLARYVGIMQGKTRLLESRIQGLLEFARMETGEWRQGFGRLELLPFLQDLSRELAEDAQLAGKRLEHRLDAAAGLIVLGDPALLRRAFENILSNAFRYCPQGSTVSLGARRGASGGRGIGLMIEVDDEGPGIPEAEREQVFEPFYRGGGAREGEGNGLGLYIARSVITGHGWSLDASSVPGGGARFTIVVPRAAWLPE